MRNSESRTSIKDVLKKTANKALPAVTVAGIALGTSGCLTNGARFDADLNIGGTEIAVSGNVTIDQVNATATTNANHAHRAVDEERRAIAHRDHRDETDFSEWTCVVDAVQGPGYVDENGDNHRNNNEPWKGNDTWWKKSSSEFADGDKRVLWEKGHEWTNRAKNVVECVNGCHINDGDDWCEPKPPTATTAPSATAGASATPKNTDATPPATATGVSTDKATASATSRSTDKPTERPTDRATASATTGASATPRNTDETPSATTGATATKDASATAKTPVASATSVASPTCPPCGETPGTPTAKPTVAPSATSSLTPCPPDTNLHTVQIFANGNQPWVEGQDRAGVFAMNGPVDRLDGWEHFRSPDMARGDAQEGVERGPNLAVEVVSIHEGEINGVPFYQQPIARCADSGASDIDAAVRGVLGLTPAGFYDRFDVVGDTCLGSELDSTGRPVDVQLRAIGPRWEQANGVMAVNAPSSGDGWKHFLNPWGARTPQVGIEQGPGLVEQLTRYGNQSIAPFPRRIEACPDGKFPDDNMSTDLTGDVRRITGNTPVELLDGLNVVGRVCLVVHN